MNPLTNVKNLNKINERELEQGIIGKKSWHDEYKDSAWIFIGGLPYDLTEGDVICVFSQYGELVNINMVRDKQTGKTKGFAFLCYEDQRSTILAVDNLNGFKLLGRTLRVDHVSNYKLPKELQDIDEVTKKIRTEGIAPRTPSPEPEVVEEEDYVVPVKKIKQEKGKEKKNKKKKDKKEKKNKEMTDSSSESSSESITGKTNIKTECEDEGYQRALVRNSRDTEVKNEHYKDRKRDLENERFSRWEGEGHSRKQGNAYKSEREYGNGESDRDRAGRIRDQYYENSDSPHRSNNNESRSSRNYPEQKSKYKEHTRDNLREPSPSYRKKERYSEQTKRCQINDSERNRETFDSRDKYRKSERNYEISSNSAKYRDSERQRTSDKHDINRERHETYHDSERQRTSDKQDINHDRYETYHDSERQRTSDKHDINRERHETYHDSERQRNSDKQDINHERHETYHDSERQRYLEKYGDSDRSKANRHDSYDRYNSKTRSSSENYRDSEHHHKRPR